MLRTSGKVSLDENGREHVMKLDENGKEIIHYPPIWEEYCNK